MHWPSRAKHDRITNHLQQFDRLGDPMNLQSTPINTGYFSLSLLLILGFGLMLSPTPAFSGTKDSDTIIDNGDLLYVIIPKEITSEFNPTERNYFKEKVEVDRHGYIFLPTQGNIKISGLSTTEISEMLTNNLPKYLSKSDKATVNLIEKRHYIQILGNVAAPGWYNIPESANIQTVLSRAGGVIDGADLSNVTIGRQDKGKTQSISVDIQQYLLKGDSSILPSLHENDTVFVPLTLNVDDISSSQPTLNTSKIRIFGAVNSPGIYPVAKERGINLLDLLITANGETADANLTEIRILRADGTKETFNMQSLLSSDSPSHSTLFPIINGGDIVHFARKTIGATTNSGNLIATPQSITITGPGGSFHGLRPFSPPMTPLEAIAQAGGVNDFANTDDIFIIRRIDGKQKNLPYNYDKALQGEEPDVDFQLEPNDIIYIP